MSNKGDCITAPATLGLLKITPGWRFQFGYGPNVKMEAKNPAYGKHSALLYGQNWFKEKNCQYGKKNCKKKTVQTVNNGLKNPV